MTVDSELIFQVTNEEICFELLITHYNMGPSVSQNLSFEDRMKEGLLN